MNTQKPVQVKVVLKNPERFYAIQDEYGNTIDFGTADGRNLFKHLRHNCTTYDDVLDGIHSQQGYVSEVQQKLVKQAAAEVIIEHFRNDNENLQTDLAKQINQKKNIVQKFKNFTTDTGKLLQKLGVNTITSGINALDDVLQKVATVEQIERAYEELEAKHEKSRTAFGRLNDAYRVHEVLTLEYLEAKGIDSEIIENLKKLYKTQSPKTAIPAFCQFTESEESLVIKRIKSKLHYTDPNKL